MVILLNNLFAVFNVLNYICNTFTFSFFKYNKKSWYKQNY